MGSPCTQCLRMSPRSKGLRRASICPETESSRHCRPTNPKESDHHLSDRAALKRKTLGLAGHFLPDWFIGRNTRDYVLITSPASPGPEHTRESVIQAAVHEYVHVLTDRRNPRLGYWLKEGIALYLADQRPEIQAIRATRDITLAEFSSPNAIQFANVGGYTLAYTLIAYLDEAYGWESVIALTAPGATYESVLGKDARSVFEEWIVRLSLL